MSRCRCSASVFGVARLNPNGTLDSTFGNGGVLTTRFRDRDQATAVLVQPNRDIVAVGNSETSDPSSSDIALARYLGP